MKPKRHGAGIPLSEWVETMGVVPDNRPVKVIQHRGPGRPAWTVDTFHRRYLDARRRVGDDLDAIAEDFGHVDSGQLVRLFRRFGRPE